MTNRRKRVLRFLTLLVILLLAASVFCIFCLIRTRGAVKAVPQSNLPVAERAVYRGYYQRDERWADDHLGDSRYTMADSGCLVCCLAAAMQMQGINDLGPDELNILLSENGGYDDQGNLQWDAFSRITGASVEIPEPSEGAELLDSLLEAGIYPIVRVRRFGFGSYHYVLLLSSSEGVYWIMDPLDKDPEMHSLKDYGNQIYAVRYLR